MNKVVFACFLSCFVLFRPYFLQSNGMMYGYGIGDDYNYFAHASAIVFGQFPSYQNECFQKSHSIGPGLMAAPFVLVFSLLDRVEGSSIIEHRTADNIIGSWSQFGFFFASVFYFCLGCLLLYKALRLYVPSAIACWSIILMVICQGMPLFAFRRPVFSHTFEFFLQSLFVFLFLFNEFNKGRWFKSWASWSWLGLAAAMMFLVRYNNVLFALVWPWFFILRHLPLKSSGEIVRRCFYVFIPFVLLVIIFKFWPEFYNSYSPYQGLRGSIFSPVMEILQRIIHVIIGLDWGLIFTAPFLFLGLAGLFLWKDPLKKSYVWLLVPLLVNFYGIVFFGSQGSWYGYRYLIASAFPLLVLPLAIFLQWLNISKKPFMFLVLVLLTLMPLVSMLTFESTSEINLNLIKQDFGMVDWTHSSYQIVAWQTVLDLPKYWINLLQGGSLYFYYLCIKIQNWFALINDRHVIYISWYDIKIFAKVMMIYSLPFAIGWLFREPKSSLKESS